MSLVRAKKQLGQHFLTDKNIAEKIVNSLQLSESVQHVLEVGPGMGILSDFLFQQKTFETYLIETNNRAIFFPVFNCSFYIFFVSLYCNL